MIQAKYHNGIYLCFLSGRMDIEQSATHLETVLLSEVQTSCIKSAFTTSIYTRSIYLMFIIPDLPHSHCSLHLSPPPSFFVYSHGRI